MNIDLARRLLPLALLACAAVAVPLAAAPAHAAGFVVSNLDPGGAGSLRDAIDQANANGLGPDQITFADGLSGTIELGGTVLDIQSNLTIVGPGSDTITVDAQQMAQVVTMSSPGLDLSISGLTLANGRTNDDGGGLQFLGGDQLTLTDVAFENNTTTASGGGLWFGGVTGDVLIADSSFTGNTSSDWGGGIYGDAGLSLGTMTVENTVVEGNSAKSGGGGIRLGGEQRQMVYRDITVSGNTALAGEVGGLITVGLGIEIDGATITANTAALRAGGLFAFTELHDIVVRDALIADNEGTGAGSLGGAFLDSSASMTIDNVIVNGNTGPDLGGLGGRAVDTVQITDSAITGNTATGPAGAAGGMFLIDTAAVVIEDTTVSGNTGPTRGGVGIALVTSTRIERTTVSGNTATGSDTGGVSFEGAAATARILSSTVSGNSTPGSGGGVATDGVDLSIEHSTITGNSAALSGGGMTQNIGDVIGISHSVVAGNTAPVAPDIEIDGTVDFSLIGDPSGATFVGGGNLIGVDPQLGPLADHGGPTMTHLPADTSPVIDAGDPAIVMPPATDQRGLARIVDTIDLGAVETRLTDYPVADGASRFVGLDPVRIYDSRAGQLPVAGPKGLVGPDGFVDVTVLGAGGVPGSGVSAVLVNVTATDVAAPSFVSAIPTPAGDAEDPTVSSVNVPVAGLTRSNLAVVPVGAGGRIRLFSKAESHIVLDVFGYFETTEVKVADGRLVPVDPFRVFDTRDGEPAPGPKGLVPDGGTIAPDMLGVGPLPGSGVSAVVINVTATEVAGPSYVTVWPDGPVTDTSSLNISTAGETVANTVIVPVGADGKIRLFTLRSAHLLGDVVGYVTDDSADVDDSGLFVTVEPGRLFDTREGQPPDVAPKGMLPGDSTLVVELPGRAGLPDDVGMVLMNLTVTEASTGFVSVFPFGSAQPLVSTLNPNPDGDTRANTTFAAVGDDGAVSFYSLAPTHLLADTAGYTLP